LSRVFRGSGFSEEIQEKDLLYEEGKAARFDVAIFAIYLSGARKNNHP